MAAANSNGPAGTGPRAGGPKCVALVGPFQSGKTTLLEAILARSGAIARAGSVDAGTSVGDGSKESRHHKMSVELSVATTTFMGESITFIDCPGSIEFLHDMRGVLPAVDAAIVVCEADEKKIPQLQLVLRELEEQKIPHILFLNKIDKADKRIRETLQLLQPASRAPLLLRQIPIWSGDIVTGFVDLALERAHVYKEHAPSEVIELSGEDLEREKTARFTMLETLADHDDELMEQLLEDIPPPRDKVFDDLAKELREGYVVPVLIGVATRANGVLRVLKAIRHEIPDVAATAKRLGVGGKNDAVAYVLKTLHTAPRRQAVDCARAVRSGRRRHDLHDCRRRCRPRLRRLQADGAEQREARRRRGRRNGRSRQARRRENRRHADRRQASASAFGRREVLSAGAGGRGGRQGAQGRRQARPGPQQAGRRGSLADGDSQPGNPRGHFVGAGRNAPACGHRTPRRALRRRHREAPALGRLSRNHPQGHAAARAAQEAVRRSRTIRRRRARHQAVAARLRLRL